MIIFNVKRRAKTKA